MSCFEVTLYQLCHWALAPRPGSPPGPTDERVGLLSVLKGQAADIKDTSFQLGSSPRNLR
ncbi:hypothetical protein PISMIDRAFT_671052 [Pisolithus microcarpus 441]|uniref:Uncharacterized protein n=1 Tax=Pisolithus microcarpus 441 TaxID=765257 RepID=A0A0D0A6L4_9AGAM|nr:hypothetical protein PISMIDRAFT_671052 [Pisolithus microcarpus 441]